MTPIHNKKMLKRKMRSLGKRQRFLKRVERKRRIRIRRLRLSQRLRLDLYNWKAKRAARIAERRKKVLAKRETAKLNRTLKRRRKR